MNKIKKPKTAVIVQISRRDNPRLVKKKTKKAIKKQKHKLVDMQKVEDS